MHVRGITAVELLTIIAVLSILASMAVPAFTGMADRNRIAADLNRFNTALQAARSHAVTVGKETVVCPSRDGRTCATDGRWESGWLAFVDADGNRQCSADTAANSCADHGRVLIVGRGLKGGTLRGTGLPANRVRFTPLGHASGYLGSFHRCSADGETRAGMTLIMTGRLRRKPEGDVVCP